MEINRKQAVLEAARKSLSLFGYKGTTMDQVARMAGVSKGSIYSFFTSKEELFDEIMQETISEMQLALQEAADTDQSVFESLHRVLFRVLEFREQHELLAKLYNEMKEVGTPAAREAVVRIEDQILFFVERQIQYAIDTGKMKPCDPKVTAFLFLKFYVGLVYEWGQRNTPLDNESISHLFQFYFGKGLAPVQPV